MTTLDLLRSPRFVIVNDADKLFACDPGEHLNPSIQYKPFASAGEFDSKHLMRAALGLGDLVASNDNEFPRFMLLTLTDVVQASIEQLALHEAGKTTGMSFPGDSTEYPHANIAAVYLDVGKIGLLRIRWQHTSRTFRIRWYDSSIANEHAPHTDGQPISKSLICVPMEGDIVMMPA